MPRVAAVRLTTYYTSSLDPDRHLNIQNFNGQIDHWWEGVQRNVISARTQICRCVTNVSRIYQGERRVIEPNRDLWSRFWVCKPGKKPNAHTSGDLERTFDGFQNHKAESQSGR